MNLSRWQKLIASSLILLIVACSSSPKNSHSLESHSDSILEPIKKKNRSGQVINGKPLTDEVKFILDHKPVYASATLSLENTRQRNATQLDRLAYLQTQIKVHALTNTPFNRSQQQQLVLEIEHLLKHRKEVEETAILSQKIYQNTINLYQCNSNLITELRSVDPSSKIIPALLQLNLEIERSKFAIYDFSRSEFKAWSELNTTEIKLNSLYDFYQSMNSDSKSMFYLKRASKTRYDANKENIRILNSCLYQHNQVDKQLQDILFHYEILSEYNKSLKKIRQFYRQTSLR